MSRALSNCVIGFLSLVLSANFLFAQPEAAKPVDAEHARKQAEGLKLFKSDVRQILLDRCASCHGVDALEGEFDLTSREALLKGTPTNKVLDLKNIGESDFWKMVSHQEQPYMPFEEEKLPQRELSLLKKWLELGAPYDKPLAESVVEATPWQEREVADASRDFWSFQKLQQVVPPKIENDTWSQTEIDKFILNALREKQITPNKLADRRTLIRRAYLDLIGLPPTPEEVESFVNDSDPQAYSKLLDKLLASDHFGERWARHWLDVARFAESHGFEQDYDRPHAYHFRDFVIRAFNQDMPYDQFVRWQLAGDELAPNEPLALMATGFLGAGVFPTQITANEVERTRYDALDDMAATTGNAFLGLSVGCARCHDHKFDPIPQADYYRFVSTFTTTVRSNVDVDLTPEKTAAALAAWEKVHQPKVAAQQKYEQASLKAGFEKWLSDPATDWQGLAQDSPWMLLEVAEAKSKNGATLTPQADGSVLASGTNPADDTYTLTSASLGSLADVKTVRLEALAHDSFVKGGPGRADNGNFALSHFTLFVEDSDGKNRQEIKLTNPRADFQQNEKNLSIAASLDSNPKTGWAVDPQFGKNHGALFDIDPSTPLSLNEKQRLVVEMNFAVNTKHAIGRPRLALSTQTEAAPEANAQSIALNRAIREREALPADGKLSDTSRSALWDYFRAQDPQWVTLNQTVQKSLNEKPQPNLVKMMIASEGVTPIRHHTQGADFFEETFFLKRGDIDQKDGQAKQGFLQVLMRDDHTTDDWKVAPPENSKLSYRRTSLANWITDSKNGPGHLLARVIVNRLWQHHFGRGLVATPNDFGTQGERPTHPELLDWLANYLIEHDWRLKPLHKLMLSSAVYQQTSDYIEAKAQADRNNQLLWRFEPRRVEAEIIRDSMLAVSGTLDETMFGPGSLDMGHKRRSIYFMIKRSQLIPMLQIFDTPEPLVSVGSRPATTVAPQALMFMNSPYVREYAENFAKNLLSQSDDPQQIVTQGYRAALGRSPSEVELNTTVGFLNSQQQSYASDDANAAQLQAVTDVCQTLFGLNEFIFVE